MLSSFWLLFIDADFLLAPVYRCSLFIGLPKMFLLDEQWAEQSLLSHLEEISEDNITPLLDVTFLLVLFIDAVFSLADETVLIR